MGYWSIGKIPLDREAIKCISSLFKPIFHHSIIPSGLHETCSTRNGVISISCTISETFKEGADSTTGKQNNTKTRNARKDK